MSDARRAADMRLANGEITLEQHAAIIAAITAYDKAGPPPADEEVQGGRGKPGVQPEQKGEQATQGLGDWVNSNWKMLLVLGFAFFLWAANNNAKSHFYNDLYRGYAQNGSFSLSRSRCFAEYITNKEGPIFLFKKSSRANIERWKRYGVEAIPYCRSNA